MFFYTSLFIACVVIALVFLFFYNSVADLGKLIYRKFHSGSKKKPAAHQEERILATTINDTPTPWGWASHATPENIARTHPAAPSRQSPWGWPGHHHETYAHHSAGVTGNTNGGGASHSHNGGASKPEETETPTVGWPYREEKFELSGKAYKVTRKARPKRTNLRTTGKPWGW